MCEVPQCLLKIFSALAAEPTRGMYSPSLSALCSGCQSFATVAVWPRQPAEQLVHVLQRRQVRTALGKRRGVSLARFRVVDHEEHAVRSDELQHRGRLRFTHASARRLRFTRGATLRLRFTQMQKNGEDSFYNLPRSSTQRPIHSTGGGVAILIAGARVCARPFFLRFFWFQYLFLRRSTVVNSVLVKDSVILVGIDD